uniref:Immunoglobulin C1-set domain-containing protein n=1 Tax=Sciurus vulgaris TaxID=55149 RepID=A0A8D2B9D2_SCIVU
MGSTKPSVFPLQSCCKSATSVTLGCLVMGYFPEPVTVTWDTGSLNASTLNFPTTQLSSGLLARTSQVTVSGTGDWPPPTARSTSPRKTGCPRAPSPARSPPTASPPGPTPRSAQVTYLIPPSPLDLYVRTAPKLTCLVVDLESKEGVEVVWTRDSQKPVSPDPWKATKQPNATFSITSTLPVDAKDWIDGETYRCMVKHPELPKPIIRTLAKAPGKRMVPKVHVFLPPEEPGSQDKLTLTCLVQNFFPMDISVQWLRNGQVHRDQQSTTAPLRTHTAHPAFFLFSRLEVARADWAPGNTFTCRVVHEALPGRRTLEETVSRSPELDLQELCAEEAESAELDELWSSTCVFVSLFLLSLSYGATITLVKVGPGTLYQIKQRHGVCLAGMRPGVRPPEPRKSSGNYPRTRTTKGRVLQKQRALGNQ